MKTKIYTLTAILIVVFVFSAYLIVFQSYHNGGVWLATLCVGLLFISILILQFLWINVSADSFWTYNMRTLLVIVLMIPIAYGLINAEDNFEERGLKVNSVIAKEVITYVYKTSSKGVISYHAVYQYTVNGQTYTHTLKNNNNVYAIGDTVKVIYSTQHPNISKVIVYKSKQL